MGRIRAGTSLRVRVLGLVVIGAVPALLALGVAFTALGKADYNIRRLDAHAVQPLAALGDTRDMEGDSRVLVYQYIDGTATQRRDLRGDIQATDAQFDADIAAYQREHGSRTDQRARLITSFQQRLQEWRGLRDHQVFVAADAGEAALARTRAAGALNSADEFMSEPLDALFSQEVSASQTLHRQAEADYAASRIELGILVLLGVAASTGLGLLICRRLLGTVHSITTVVRSDDPQLRVNSSDPTELGELGRAVDVMLDQLIDRDNQLEAAAATREQQLVRGNVRRRLSEQQVRCRAQSVIDDAVEAVTGELAEVITQAEAVRLGADTIDAKAGDAAARTLAVVDQAGDADVVVAAVETSLQQVAGIARLIAGVAGQTNLLALNASIEAARAGEAGRGFSVVAAEVKDLATETARSTQEITRTIDTLERDTAAMATVIRNMAEGIGGMAQATAEVTSVAGAQREAVGRLDTCTTDAIARVEAMHSLTDQLDRRSSERVIFTGTAHIGRAGQTKEVNLIDLSEGGLRCAVADGPGVGETVQVGLELSSGRMDLTARVAYEGTGHEGSELGLEFVNVSPEQRKQISAQLAALTNLPQEDQEEHSAVPA